MSRRKIAPVAAPAADKKQSPPNLTPKEFGGIRYTAAETREQMQFVAELDAKYATVPQIRQLFMDKKGIRISRHRVERLLQRVREEWRGEDDRNRSFWKARQIRSIEDDIRAARAKKDYASVGRLQQLLAKIMGTEEPVRVQADVVVTQAIMQVVGALSPEQMNAMLEEERALDDDAKKWRQLQAAEVSAG